MLREGEADAPAVTLSPLPRESGGASDIDDTHFLAPRHFDDTATL